MKEGAGPPTSQRDMSVGLYNSSLVRPLVLTSSKLPASPSSLLPHHPQARIDACTVTGASISSEADGALAGELGPGAGATGCIGVTPMSADVARILKGIRGAVCEGGDINQVSIQKLLQVSSFHSK